MRFGGNRRDLEVGSSSAERAPLTGGFATYPVAPADTSWQAPRAKPLTQQEVDERRAFWEHLEAGPRLQRLLAQHPLIPPRFSLPRARVSNYTMLAKGPSRYVLQELRLSGAHNARKKSSEKVVSLEQRAEDVNTKVSREEILKRAYEEQGTVRRFGGQMLILFVFFVLEWVMFHAHAEARWASIIFQTIGFLWIMTVVMFFCSWAKGVVRTSRIVFLWLARTFDAVQHSGEMISLEVRRQLVLRVLGALHVREEEQHALTARLNGHFDDKLQFPSYLMTDRSYFKPSEYESDNHVESGCVFVDNDGILQRFVWKPTRERNQLEMRTEVMNFKNKSSQLHDQTHSPWADRDLSTYMVDIQSDRFQRIVSKNPWWEKLEFRLRSEQHQIQGFRYYLGHLAFNTESRLIFWCLFIPVSTMLLIAAVHTKFVRDNPRIAVDSFLILPHFGLVVTFAFVSILVSFLANKPEFTRFFVNACMSTLEAQVNKEWALIMQDATVVPDPVQLWHTPDAYLDENNIWTLWQVTTCEESMQAIAKAFKEEYSSNTSLLVKRQADLVRGDITGTMTSIGRSLGLTA